MRIGRLGGGAVGAALERRAAAARGELVALPDEGLPIDALVGLDAVVVVATRQCGDGAPRPWDGDDAPFSAGLQREASPEALDRWASQRLAPLREASRAAGGVRVVLISSTAVFGPPVAVPSRETDPLRPVSRRARELWALERAAFAAHAAGALRLSVVRPALLYGAEVAGAFSALLAGLALLSRPDGRALLPRRGPVLHLCHVDDAADAALALATHRWGDEIAGRAFLCADDVPRPLEDLARALLASIGAPPPRRAPWLSPLLRLSALLGRVLPGSLAELPERTLASDFARLVRRAGLPRDGRVHFRHGLSLLAWDHYVDAARLRALGWRPAHADALPSLLAFVAARPELRLVFATPALAAAAGARVLPR